MKKMLKRTFILFITITIIITNIAFAVSKKDSTDLQNKINQAKDNLKDVNNDKNDAENEVDKLQDEIDEYQGSIDTLNDKLDDLNNSINENEKKLKEKQKEYNENSDLLDERLVTIYEAGTVSYLDVLLSSDSLVDFISNYYLITELTSYDLDLLEQMQKEKQEIEDTKKQ